MDGIYFYFIYQLFKDKYLDKNNFLKLSVRFLQKYILLVPVTVQTPDLYALRVNPHRSMKIIAFLFLNNFELNF